MPKPPGSEKRCDAVLWDTKHQSLLDKLEQFATLPLVHKSGCESRIQ